MSRHAALLTCFCVMAGLASAWTFNFDDFRQGPYTHDGYRLLPFWRIGVWNDDSSPAKWSPKKFAAHVEVSLSFTGATVVQFFMYDIGLVEGQFYLQYADPNPCMDAGQASGVADRYNLTELGSVIIDANDSGMTAANKSWIMSSAKLQTTGLYAFGFVTCRYMYKDLTNPTAAPVSAIPLTGNPNNYRRVLVNGPSELAVSGSVTVYEPYGSLPGQAFGFIPLYALLFVAIVLTTIALLIAMVCAGGKRVVVYHWYLFEALISTLFVCIFFLAYIGQINLENNKVYGLAVAAYIFQRMRDGAARLMAVLLASGFGITRRTLRWQHIAAAIFYWCVYFLTGVAAIVGAQSSGDQVLGLAAVTTLAPAPTYVLLVLVELALAVVMLAVFGYHAHRTFKQLSIQAVDKPRRTLFTLSLATIIAFAIINVMVSASSVANSQLKGKGTEAGWKYWFLEGCIMDVFFIIAIIVLAMIWFPRDATMSIPDGAYRDDANYAGFEAEENEGVRRRRPITTDAQHGDVDMTPRDMGDEVVVGPGATGEHARPAVYRSSSTAISYDEPTPDVAGPAAAAAAAEAGGPSSGGFDDLDRA